MRSGTEICLWSGWRVWYLWQTGLRKTLATFLNGNSESHLKQNWELAQPSLQILWVATWVVLLSPPTHLKSLKYRLMWHKILMVQKPTLDCPVVSQMTRWTANNYLPDDVITQLPVPIAHTAGDQCQVDVHLHQLKRSQIQKLTRIACPSEQSPFSWYISANFYIWEILRTHLELWSCVELSVEDDPAHPPEGDQDEVVAEVEDGQHGEDAQPEPDVEY